MTRRRLRALLTAGVGRSLDHRRQPAGAGVDRLRPDQLRAERAHRRT